MSSSQLTQLRPKALDFRVSGSLPNPFTGAFQLFKFFLPVWVPGALYRSSFWNHPATVAPPGPCGVAHSASDSDSPAILLEVLVLSQGVSVNLAIT